MNQNFELKLQAWLDGELSDQEARRLGEEIAGDAEATQLVAELRAIQRTLAGNELAVTVPETREFYWSKIERQIQREAAVLERARPSRPSTWVRWVSPLVGFSSLACMLALAFYQPFTPPSFDEISATGEGMEAVTYHDQSTGMTVVWLADSQESQSTESATDVKSPDAPDPQVEME